MASTEDDAKWGDAVAKKTFILTALSAALFVAAVVIFIL